MDQVSIMIENNYLIFNEEKLIVTQKGLFVLDSILPKILK